MKIETKAIAFAIKEVETCLDQPDTITLEGRLPANMNFNENRIIECNINISIPETLKEFKEFHNLTKEELLDWLNENYK